MWIVFNEFTNEAVKTEDPRSVLREWVAKEAEKQGERAILGWDAEFVTKENLDWHFEQLGPDGGLSEWDQAFTGFMVLSDVEDHEGSEGIAVGFSSSDRESFPMPWPESKETEDFLGNGDPMVYKTVGVGPGVIVKGVEEILPAN